MIDPVKRDVAKRSDVWLQVKPGADGLLALGLIKVIIEEELYDKDFVAKWTSGFEELKSYAANCSLRNIEKETWISTEDLKKAARLYAGPSLRGILWGNAIDHNVNSVQTARALLILMGLSGNLIGLEGILMQHRQRSSEQAILCWEKDIVSLKIK